MVTYSSYEPGTPSWVDLMSPDVDASVAFYTAVFGWTAEDQHDDDGNRVYVMFRKDGKDVAGLGGQWPGMDDLPAIWNSYVTVEDVDATTAAVEAAGGTVTAPPMDVMDSGRMAVYADPTGAMISAWQPGDHIGAEVVNEPDTYSWNELMTRDIDRARDFYHEVFGWEYDAMDMPDGSTYYVIEGGDQGGWGGLMAMPSEMPEQVPAHWAVYFTVADVEAKIAKVVEEGGQLVQPPMEIAGVGTMATVHDPQGGSFMLLQPAGQSG